MSSTHRLSGKRTEWCGSRYKNMVKIFTHPTCKRRRIYWDQGFIDVSAISKLRLENKNKSWCLKMKKKRFYSTPGSFPFFFKFILTTTLLMVEKRLNHQVSFLYFCLSVSWQLISWVVVLLNLCVFFFHWNSSRIYNYSVRQFYPFEYIHTYIHTYIKTDISWQMAVVVIIKIYNANNLINNKFNLLRTYKLFKIIN